MKRFYLFVGFVVIALLNSNAQTPVTFIVDFVGAGVTVNPNGVHIAGNFADPNYNGSVINPEYINWNPSSLAMIDNGDGTFSITLNLMPAHYEFKFINGNDWPFVEDAPNICQVELNGNDNRFIDVSFEPITYSVCYGSCADCGTNSVLLRVDMSMVDSDGDGIKAEIGEDIHPAGIHVAGSFNGWDPAATALTPMGNNVYGVILPVASGDYQYKFINGNAWGFEESSIDACFVGGNRQLIVDQPNILTDAFCFGSCTSCVMPTMVTFRINMLNQVVSPDGLHLAGQFQGWDPGSPLWEFTDVGANIFELQKEILPGTYQFQLVNGSSWSSQLEVIPIECQIAGNREIVITGSEMTTEYCFGSCNSNCSSIGCTNSQACNFNPNATGDDGSCLFIGNPCNDNNLNTFDDIITDACICSGTEFLSGCMNQTACNYNPSANINSGDCRFVGDLCNDNIYATIQDAIDQNCVCTGTPTDLNGNNENTYQGLFYQAVARNADGTPMANQVISLRFSLHQSTATGAIEYQEVQNVNSNALGLFTTYFGTGQASVGNFNNIQWGINAKYLQVEMYTTNWQTLGTQQLAAVPYAIRAQQVEPTGLKLQSPNGNCYILQVNNSGQLSTIAVPCD